MTPAGLIRDHACCGPCLLANTNPARCKCPCAGEFHGALAAVDITAMVDARRWRRLQLLTDQEVIGL